MRNVLVTGASGLIGKEVCDGLLAKNFNVVGTDNKANPLEGKPNFKFVRTSIENKDAVAKIISDNKIDAVVHLACTVDNDYPPILSVDEERESAAVDKYIYKLAVSENVKDFILVSTHQVYAPQKTREPIREVSLEKATTLYSKMKLDAEKAFQNALRKASATTGVIARICPVYTKSFIDNLHSKVFDPKEGCAFIYGYGDYGYSFTCVFNLVDFVIGILSQKNNGNYQGIYNVCDSKPIQAKEIVEFERAAGKLGAVIQRNYSVDTVKSSVFGFSIVNNKIAKYDYRYNDLSVACSNISYDNTKAQRISSFRWKLSNTK